MYANMYAPFFYPNRIHVTGTARKCFPLADEPMYVLNILLTLRMRKLTLLEYSSQLPQVTQTSRAQTQAV